MSVAIPTDLPVRKEERKMWKALPMLIPILAWAGTRAQSRPRGAI